MKMKESEAYERLEGLTELKDLVLPSKLSFAVSHNIEKLREEVERLDRERKKICEQYAEKGSGGEPLYDESVVNGKQTQEYRMTVENKRACLEEYRDLLESEADIDIRMAPANLIGRCEETERYSIPSVRQLAALAFMLED